MSSAENESARRNWILRGIPAAALSRLMPDLELRQMRVRDNTVSRGREIREVFFPLSCMLSTVASAADEHGGIEVAVIGNEGMSGVAVFLGPSKTGTLETFAQISGEALCMQVREFREHKARETSFARLLGCYVQTLITQISQASACNRLHPADQRCARWLLMSHDRVARDEFELTQQFIAQMLGLRRATVSEIATKLQDDELIRYSRGKVTILNRPGLEKRSCACYRIVRAECERLFLPGRL